MGGRVSSTCTGRDFRSSRKNPEGVFNYFRQLAVQLAAQPAVKLAALRAACSLRFTLAVGQVVLLVASPVQATAHSAPQLAVKRALQLTCTLGRCRRSCFCSRSVPACTVSMSSEDFQVFQRDLNLAIAR